MSTFGVIKARVAAEMKRGELTASATAVQSSVLSAIARLERRRFTWNEFSDTTATASSSVAYVPFAQLGVTPLAIDSVKCLIGTRNFTLIERSHKELDDIDASQYYGTPDYYAIHSRSVRLYPAPSSDYKIVLSGVKKLTEISANASANATNAWMTDGEELVRMTAKAMLFRDELRAPELAGYFEAEAAKTQRELQRETAALTNSRIRPRFF